MWEYNPELVHVETESTIPNPGVQCEIYGSSPGKGKDGSIFTLEILRLGILVVWLSLCLLFSFSLWLQTLYCLVNLLRGSLSVDEARGMNILRCILCLPNWD